MRTSTLLSQVRTPRGNVIIARGRVCMGGARCAYGRGLKFAGPDAWGGAIFDGSGLDLNQQKDGE